MRLHGGAFDVLTHRLAPSISCLMPHSHRFTSAGTPHDVATCRFSWGLGMPMVAKSDLSTQNSTFASYVLQSGELTFALTAPYSRARRREGSTPPLPWYDQDIAYEFLNRHGLAVRAIGGAYAGYCRSAIAVALHGATGLSSAQLLDHIHQALFATLSCYSCLKAVAHVFINST